MFFKMSILLQLLLTSNMLFANGNDMQNGGDLVNCTASEQNEFQGYYSLDYLVTFDYLNNNSDITNLSTEASFARIQSILDNKLPVLGVKFRSYLERLFKKSPIETRSWERAEFGLKQIRDESLIGKLPTNCLYADNPMIYQAIVRETRSKIIIYHYDPNLLKLIKDKGVQLSFTIVHEWLWDFAPNARVIRDVNRLLHSDIIENLSDVELGEALENLGLVFTSQSGLNKQLSGYVSADLWKLIGPIVAEGAQLNHVVEGYRGDCGAKQTISLLQMALCADSINSFAYLLSDSSVDVNYQTSKSLETALHLALKIEHGHVGT